MVSPLALPSTKNKIHACVSVQIRMPTNCPYSKWFPTCYLTELRHSRFAYEARTTRAINIDFMSYGIISFGLRTPALHES